jgi:hypothetical protein
MRPVKPARFILSLLGVALFLAIGTVIILSAIVQSSGTPMVDWGTRAGSTLGAVLLAVLMLRAILLRVENRKQRR